MTFKELVWKTHPVFDNGKQAEVSFDNGYGASIITGDGAYTSGSDYELAVLKDGKLCYDTPITDDVLGYLSEDDVTTTLAQIEAL